MNKNAFYINKADNNIPESRTAEILRNSDSHAFHSKQDNYSPTPLIELPSLAASLKLGKLYVKDESHRMGINSFKGLGSFYALESLVSTDADINTLCTATDGNHGRAVARAARKYGKKAVVFIPQDCSSERGKAIIEEGAHVQRVEGNYDEACRQAKEFSDREGCALIQDTASPGYEEIPALIMAGYLSIFQEMEDTINSLPAPAFDLVLLQAGVGSFAAAASWYYQNRYTSLRPRIVIVEPYEADAVCNSLEKGRWSCSEASNNTIMAGLNCSTPSTSALEIIRHSADIAIRIDDRFSKEAIKRLYHVTGKDERIYSGESGAAGLAGLIAICEDDSYKEVKAILDINKETRVLLINTEGATDRESFSRIISGIDTQYI